MGVGPTPPGFVKVRTACAIGLENAVDHDAMEMRVGIEQSAKAVDEGDGADPGSRTRSRTTPAQTLLRPREEDVQRQSAKRSAV
jgi:hypothetical protein